MNILGIETSADETSVAVVRDGREVLSCSVASSMKIHVSTGGIVPENAARKQIEYIIPTLEDALTTAFPDEDIKNKKKLFSNIDAIAVTIGHGLIGSLLVGVETAKTLATIFDKPIIPVDHVKAHVYGAFLGETAPQFPAIALIVSGGHTGIVLMKDHHTFEWVGGTRDDAAGECFDKCARLLGLPYPGGPSIAKAAQAFMEKNKDFKFNLFPRPMIHDKTSDMSFSGLKTAVKQMVEKNKKEALYSIEQLAAEVQAAIVDTLITKTEIATLEKKPKSLIVCGGVSANIELRNAFQALQSIKLPFLDLHVPPFKYTTDNAAMVASYAFFNNNPQEPKEVYPNPELHF